MTYQSAPALRTALERRLLERSTETGASLDRLRRRVMFERIIARMQAAEPGQWVLKGGMALEVRLRDDARLTKDVDLGLRDDVNSAPDLYERLIDILTVDLDHDYFIFTTGPPERLRDGSGGVLPGGPKSARNWPTNLSDASSSTCPPGLMNFMPPTDSPYPAPWRSPVSQQLRSKRSTSTDMRQRSSTACSATSGNVRTRGSATSSTSPSCSNTTCSYPSKRQPPFDPCGWNATTPNRRTTSRSCQSRGRTATSDLLPATE